MRPGMARLTLGLGSAALLAAAAACSSSSSSSTSAAAPASPASSAAGAASASASAAGAGSGSAAGAGSGGAAAAGTCGSIPTISYTDKSGLVAGLGSYAANYNGFDGTIYASPWSTWKGKSSGIKVGILIDGLTNPFQPELESSLESDFKALGYRTVALAPSSDSVTSQLQGYQTLLNDHVDLIVAQVQSPTAYNSLIDKAARQGIPTVGVLNEIDDANAVNVVPNSVLGGAELAQFVVRQAQEKGLVLFLHGIPGVSIDTDTVNGANAVLKLCSGITANESIVTQFAPPIAKQQVLSFLSTHTQPVAGVITAGPFTSGVIQAFLQAGKTVPVITNNGLDEGGLAYWIQHKSTFNGVALANTPNGLASAVAQVTSKMFAGDGVKLNTLAIAPPVATSDNLTKYVTVDPSWTINTAGTATGPASAYVSQAYLDSIFTR